MKKWILSFLIALLIVVGIAYYFLTQDTYHNQFVNKEKIQLDEKYMSHRNLATGIEYAASSWPAAHRDARNSDYTPFYTSKEMTFSWMDLSYAGFFIGPTIGPEGNVYLPTGFGAGYSNLHCYDRFGNLLWESPRLEKGKELDGVDWGCEINAPIVDHDGNVYQADWNQLWSFTNTGKLRWVVDMRKHGIEGMFISPFFLKDYIGGSSTDGYVALFNRKTGEFFTKLKLPGTKGPESLPVFPGLWDTQMAPEMRQFAWDAVFGCNMQCSNTPAVDPVTGRIFVVANGDGENEGVIHAIDLTPEGMKIAFTTSTGEGGSGTSPSLSFDGKIIIFTDGDGYFNGVDTETGKIVWRRDSKSANGVSSTTTPNGLAVNFAVNKFTAFDIHTGELKWSVNLDSIADKNLKGLVGFKSTPAGGIHSNILATPDKFWVLFLSIAKMPLTKEQQEKNNMVKVPVKGIPKDSVRIPQRYYLCSFDYDGNLLTKTPAPGDGAIISAGIDGRIYVTGLSVISDIVYHQTPAIFRTTPKPTSGIWCYEPSSFTNHAKEKMAFVADYCRKDTTDAMYGYLTSEQKRDIALEHLDGIRIALKEAVFRKEIKKEKADKIIKSLAAPAQLIDAGNYTEAAAKLEKAAKGI